MDETRIILHLDMDSFYASVEMREHPELRNKPVVIGADPKEGRGRGVVLTCSYEARAFGIRSAMPVSQAIRLCPHAVFHSPDFDKYAHASGNVMKILKSSGFRFQQVSIDEAYLDLTPLGSFHAAELFAKQLRETIGKELGLSSSIGIAKSKLIAKIASDFRKPAGLTVVEPGATELFLSPLPVRKIPGIGKKAELALFELGIRTIGELAAFDTRQLVAEFGRGAIALHEAACGNDAGEVKEQANPGSISCEITFDRNTDDPAVLFRTLESLADEVFARLGERPGFRTLTVKVRYQGFVTRTHARTLSHHIRRKEILLRYARSLLQEMIDGKEVRLLGIRLSSLEKPDPLQKVLDFS